MNYFVSQGDKEVILDVDERGVAHYKVVLDGKEISVDAHKVETNTWSIIVDGKVYEVDLEVKDGEFEILIKGDSYSMRVLNEQKRALSRVADSAEGGKQVITSPMPGKVVRILVEEGEEVDSQQGVIVIEAMKMENEFKSKSPGKVKEIFISEGDIVEGGDKLLLIE